MGVSLRLVEYSASGDVRNEVWLLREEPSSDDDFIATGFDLGYPEARTSVSAATETNGVDDLTQFHDASTITVDGILMSDIRAVIHDQLRGMCLPNKRCYLYVKRPEWLQARRMKVRANSYSFQSDQSSAAFWKVALSWSNPSGEMESEDLSTVTFTSSGVGDGGTTPPVTGLGGYGSLLYGEGAYGSSPAPVGLMERPISLERIFGVDSTTTTDTTVYSYGYGRHEYGSLNYGSDAGGTQGSGGDGQNNYIYTIGNVNVLPKITITGGFTDLLLNFNSVGTSLYLKGLTVADGDKLIIDVPSSSILLNGDIDQSKIANLSIAKADGWTGWPYFTNGQNDIDIITGSKTANFSVTFEFRDAWV